MLFVRYESWRQYIRLYPVNSSIMILCVIMFAAELIGGGFTFDNLMRLGAINNLEGSAGAWRYVAALFLHGSWPHLIFNLFGLFVFAAPLERIFGHLRYGLFYLVSGILGNLIAVWMANGPWYAVGASTAIYGIYGAYLFICLLERERLDQGSRTTVYGILATGLIYSFIFPNIGYWAHIGGLAAGFVLYGIFRRR
ncbi:rhomboid family intramembrane serine protease [Cohnella lubricantis]|uniref:Rhomboid family intramembrane serine protease n=1 Tax=Cohnella lubricantis TaxID=2163172 RepID=A0A841TCV3_9BACL|nr:rhomboid family intramembrane serine protease [Cohnella lubricantis]MBB6678852.1 rhomboid family intramembrane serine protease [Cohnella lubricantis]MBP2118245.1 rhomboid protease GluP [Cohnella lubricantis]